MATKGFEWAKNEKRWTKYFCGSEWLTNSSATSSSIYVTVDNAVPAGQIVYCYPQQTLTYPVPTNINWQLGGELTGWQYQSSYPNWMWQLGGLGASAVQNIAVPETEELKAERLKRLAELEVKRKAAERRAERLLFSILTPAQVRQYRDDQYFDVPIIDRIYRIKKGVSRNIEVIEAGKVKALLCAHPSDAYEVPVPDVMLSQLLALRADEAGFLRVANQTVM